MYKSYYEEYLFPSITQRYKSKYGTSFPLSGTNYFEPTDTDLNSQTEFPYFRQLGSRAP